MPSWNDLLGELEAEPDDAAKVNWLRQKQQDTLKAVSVERQDRNVILYASAFLQKPQLPAPNLSLTAEEINGFMAVLYGMTRGKGLTLLLHTPGGVTNAAETMVAYLWSKFSDFEVIIPTYADGPSPTAARSGGRTAPAPRRDRYRSRRPRPRRAQAR